MKDRIEVFIQKWKRHILSFNGILFRFMQKNIGYEHFLYVFKISFVNFFIICEYQDIKMLY